jgi:predicted nucleotidyltransferase component of viral defense system
MDIDIKIIAKNTLHKKVNLILDSKPFRQILESNKIIIDNFSDPTQTETTQRWKILLKCASSSIALPTKIEFSRREEQEDTLYESINSTILHEYLLPPLFSNHYSATKAYEQKLRALINRKETQARDVFDLYHLICQGVDTKIKDSELASQLDKAQDNALSITFEEFKGQVVVYLLDNYREQFDSTLIWEKIQTTVITKLKERHYETD